MMVTMSPDTSMLSRCNIVVFPCPQLPCLQRSYLELSYLKQWASLAASPACAHSAARRAAAAWIARARARARGG
jgi:hypothetical protein